MSKSKNLFQNRATPVRASQNTGLKLRCIAVENDFACSYILQYKSAASPKILCVSINFCVTVSTVSYSTHNVQRIDFSFDRHFNAMAIHSNVCFFSAVLFCSHRLYVHFFILLQISKQNLGSWPFRNRYSVDTLKRPRHLGGGVCVTQVETPLGFTLPAL